LKSDRDVERSHCFKNPPRRSLGVASVKARQVGAIRVLVTEIDCVLSVFVGSSVHLGGVK